MTSNVTHLIYDSDNFWLSTFNLQYPRVSVGVPLCQSWRPWSCLKRARPTRQENDEVANLAALPVIVSMSLSDMVAQMSMNAPMPRYGVGDPRPKKSCWLCLWNISFGGLLLQMHWRIVKGRAGRLWTSWRYHTWMESLWPLEEIESNWGHFRWLPGGFSDAFF